MTEAEIQSMIDTIDAKIVQIIADGALASKLGDYQPNQPQQLAALRETRTYYIDLLSDEGGPSFARTGVDLADA